MASNRITQPLQRRSARASCAAALACTWLAACAEPAGGADRPDSALVVLLPRDALEIDPRFTRDAYGLKVSRLLFASLVTIDPDRLEVVPDLAERVDVETPIR
jgi:ABC-type oligopeptide transport system substrate-binding subunit